jgi:hypothetical protein
MQKLHSFTKNNGGLNELWGYYNHLIFIPGAKLIKY